MAGKVVEAVNVDGQWFVEKDGDFVPYVAASRSGSFMGEKVTFVEGETYLNYFGEAKVMWLKAETMVVKYVAAVRGRASVGQVSEYPIRAQIETVVKAKDDEKKALAAVGVAVIGAGDMPLVNWIAEKGVIHVQMRPDMKEKFEDEYEGLTGKKAELDEANRNFVCYGSGYFAGCFSLYAVFSKPPAGAKMPSNLVVFEVGKDKCRINNNAFLKGALKAGLKLGTNEGVKLAA